MAGKLKNLRQFWALGGLSLEQNREAAIREDGTVSVVWWHGARERPRHILGVQAALCGKSLSGGSWIGSPFTPSSAIVDLRLCEECVGHLLAVLEVKKPSDQSWREARRDRQRLFGASQAV